MNKHQQPITLLIGMSLLLSCITACGGQPGKLSPEEAVTKAYTATTTIAQSVHYTITGAISASGETQEIHGEGDILFPDRERLKIEVAGQMIEIVRISDKQYLKLPGATEWQVHELGSGPQSLQAEPVDALKYLQSITAVIQLPDETVAGVLCEHYQGIIDVAQHLATMEMAVTERSNSEIQQEWPAPRERLEDASITVEVWIGKENHLVYQENLNMTADFTPPPPAHGLPAEKITITSTQTIRFSAFDQPLEIEAPF